MDADKTTIVKEGGTTSELVVLQLYSSINNDTKVVIL